MAVPVIMPRQGQSVESCILIEWLVKAGDDVQEGQALANIETDKAVFEVEAPQAGTIVELFFEENADIPVLTTICAIGTAGEDVSGLRPSGAAAPAGDKEPEAVEPPVAVADVASNRKPNVCDSTREALREAVPTIGEPYQYCCCCY